MRILTLKRTHSITDGQFGIFDIEGIPSFVSCELPWKDNKPGLSSVPTGEYTLDRFYSERFKMELFKLRNVLNRTDVEIHPGNTIYDIEGCILLGLSFGVIDTKSNGQVWGVRDSKTAIGIFMAKMLGENQAKLVIVNA